MEQIKLTQTQQSTSTQIGIETTQLVTPLIDEREITDTVMGFDKGIKEELGGYSRIRGKHICK